MRWMIWMVVGALSLAILLMMFTLSTPSKGPGVQPSYCAIPYLCE